MPSSREPTDHLPYEFQHPDQVRISTRALTPSTTARWPLASNPLTPGPPNYSAEPTVTEYSEPPPPYPARTLTLTSPRQSLHDTRFSMGRVFERRYCHKHTLLATAVPGGLTTVHHWKWEDGKLRLSSVPTKCMHESLGIVEGLKDLGPCALPGGDGDANDTRVARLVETLVTELAEGHGRGQRANLTTASLEPDEVISYIQKRHLSPHPQSSASETTADTPTTHAQLFALPVFSKSPAAVAAGEGPHMVWGMLEPTRPGPSGGGWRAELNEYLWHWELGPGWADVYRRYPMRLLAAGVTDETYGMMVRGEGRPAGPI